MSTPKNSAEVAIKLVDKARSMGIPVKMESSLVAHSDSRYVILFPKTVAQAVIRISSHPAYEPRYVLDLNIRYPEWINPSVREGLEYLENNYGDGTLRAAYERGGLASAPAAVRGRGGNGHSRSGGTDPVGGRDPDRKNWVRGRLPRRVRGSGPLPERPRGQAQRVCPEWSGDD